MVDKISIIWYYVGYISEERSDNDGDVFWREYNLIEPYVTESMDFCFCGVWKKIKSHYFLYKAELRADFYLLFL